MGKKLKAISGALFPTPVVMVTTVDNQHKPNIITLAWVGVVCSDPFMVSISIRPSRYSHELLSKIPEFVLNVPGANLVHQTDWCGTISGRVVNKFEKTGLTPEKADHVRPPIIKECPLNLECQVKEVLRLGTHDLFVGEVLAVHVDEGILDAKGHLDCLKISPFIYQQLDYWTLKEKIGFYGFTKRG